MGRRGHQHDERHQRRAVRRAFLIFGGGTLFETALTARHQSALCPDEPFLSPKLERRVGLIDRMLFSFMMTDEVFAVASGQKGEVGKRYLFGVMIAPYCGWALGTLCGAVASGFLPPSVRSALSIAIYGMFIAIVVPVAKQSRAVLGVVALAVALQLRYALGACAEHGFQRFFPSSSAPCWRRAWALAAPVPDEPSEHRTGRWRK